MALNAPTLAEQTSKVYRLLRGFHATYAIDIGIQLGFLEKIAQAGEKGITTSELAHRCNTNQRYTLYWCQMLTSLELLESPGQEQLSTSDQSIRYRLPAYLDQILGRKDDAFYIGGSARSHIEISHDYARFPELFRNGKTFPFQAHSKKFLSSVASSNRALAKRLIALILPRLPEVRHRLESEEMKILDIGCGGGHAIVEFAKTFPKCECLGIDIEPQSIRKAIQLIAKNRLGKRVSARIAKGTNYGRAGTFDLVTMFLSLHEISPKLKQQVLDSAFRSLKPGGTLLIYDEAYPEKISELKQEPQLFAVMAQWFEGPWGNVIGTSDEIKEMVSSAGFAVTTEMKFSRFYILAGAKH
ncbi:MAG TPA: class I SAM-dependent methyltransferase [Nitrososphaerales archaeon]|nr:class I SAM-dependent methyltransferase [Nitrososphaerales archaeon]